MRGQSIASISPIAVTTSRFILSPLFFLAHQSLLPYLQRRGEIAQLFPIILLSLLWILFALIELSDVLDGRIARKRSQVSNTGKILDPLADIFSKFTYFACFIISEVLPIWMFMLIIYRELVMVTLRMLLAINGIAFAARFYGKFKTFCYFVVSGLTLLMYSLMLFFPGYPIVAISRTVVGAGFLITTIISLASLVGYLWSMRREGLFQKM